MDENKSQSYAIPAAIIVGFGLIAVAIFFSGKMGDSPLAGTGSTGGTEQQEQQQQGSAENINPVTEDDHIRGNPNAPILIVEYSDFDCPFCKNFHETMQRVMDEYGADGQVAWVYRHFPLEQLHPNAPQIAQASECVADLGGNEAFWTFADLVFEERSQNAQTNMVNVPQYAVTAGVELDEFESCMESGDTRGEVEEDFNNALAIGGRGTPHSVIMVGDQQGVINGAQPYETVRGIIENLLSQLEGGGAGNAEG